MRGWKTLIVPALLILFAWPLSAPSLRESAQAEKQNRRQRMLPSFVIDYLERNYGLTEDQLRLSRWVPQLRAEELAGLPQRSALSDVPLPSGYSTKTEGARLLFPHVADGSLGAGGRFYQTSFALSGNQFYDAIGTIEFFQDNGAPLTVNLNGVSGSSFPISLKKGEVKRLATSGSGTPKAGWARVMTDQPISGGVSFGIRDNAGVIYADVGVDEAAPGREFTLFADTKGETDTGLALVNPSGTESAVLRVELYGADGISRAVESVTLPPLGHTASYVSQLFARVQGIAEFEGSVRITSDKLFCGTTLRIIGDQMTTLPLLPPASVSDDEVYLPQVANGSSVSAGIRYATTVVLFNTGTERSTGAVYFYASDGTNWNLALGGKTGNEYVYDIAPKGVLRVTTDSAGPIQTGWAAVMSTSSQGIQAAAVFHVQNLSGRLVTEVGVQGVAKSRQFRLQADTLGPFDTGIAVANPYAYAAAGVQLALYDSTGVKKAETCVGLGGNQQTAVFLSQLFPNFPGIQEFSGFLMVTGTRTLAVLSLRSVAEKLTSVPAVRSKLGFRPIAVMNLQQEGSGASPPVRWQVRANAFDLAMARATFTANAMGLRTGSIKEKAPFAVSITYVDNVAGLFGGQVLGMVEMLIADKVTASSVEFVIQGMQGKLSGSPTGGLKLEWKPNSSSKPGSTNFASDLDTEIYLPAGIVTTPAGMRSTDVVTEFVSAPLSAEYASDILTCTVRHNPPLTPVDATKAQITGLEPPFLLPGALLKVAGTNLGSQPSILFKMSDGSDVGADLLDLSSGVLSIQVPTTGIATEMRINNGTGFGLPVKMIMPFAPIFEFWTATRVGSTSTPFSLILRQEARQLATADFETTIVGVDCNLAALIPGAILGNSWVAGAVIAQGRIGLWDMKVESSGASRAVIQLVPPGKDTSAGKITLEKVTDPARGIRILFSPVVAAQSLSSLPAAAQYFAAQKAFNFTGLLLQLSAAGQQVLCRAAINSVPFGEGKPPVNVQRAFGFRTMQGTPQQPPTTTVPLPPSTSTTTTFPCPPGSLPTTTSTSTPTTLRTTTTTSASTSTTLRVTTTTSTSTTLRVTTTTTTVPGSGAQLSLGSASGTPGSTVIVQASLTSSGTVGGLQFDIAFDTSLLTLVQTTTGPAAAGAGKSVQQGAIGPGQARILVSGLNTNVISNGVVAEMQFRIATGVSGQAQITISNFIATTPQGTRVTPASATGGTISVMPGTTTTISTTTTSTARPTTTTTLLGSPCDLFSDDFTRSSLGSWTPLQGFFGNWQIVNGWLQVSGMATGEVASIERRGLPAPNYFTLHVDIQADGFTGPYYGIDPYSETLVFRLSNGMQVDGIGAGLDASGRVGFLVYDLTSLQFTLLDALDYGAITKIGVQYSAEGITLLVNGVARRIIRVAMATAPSMGIVSLVGSGPGVQRFDNVCQSRLSLAVVPQEKNEAIAASSLRVVAIEKPLAAAGRVRKGR